MPRHSSVWYLQLKQQQQQIEIYHQLTDPDKLPTFTSRLNRNLS
jgi:hypothetical protein